MDSKNHLRQRLRAAADIVSHLTPPSQGARTGQLPHRTWGDTSRTLARLGFAISHGWQAAQGRILLDAQYVLRQLGREVETLQHTLPPTSQSNVASLRDLLADFQALEEEFQRIELDPHEHTLCVWTAPIVLQGVELGSFRIALHWRKIGRERAYEVNAEEACASREDSDVTHPHVQNETLCEGEGSAAIRAALQQGRLLDFFCLVRQILLTYNPGSAYVSLNTWDGQGCGDCGERISRDDASICERCRDTVCDACSSFCRSCEINLCGSCTVRCGDCSEDFCVACLSAASDTRLVCHSCLHSEENANETLEPSDLSQPAAAPQPDEASQSDPALHAVCLGEAAVPA